LRKGNEENKLALLYEVVAEDTSEERTSERRRGREGKDKPQKRTEREKPQQLELITSPPEYEIGRERSPKAAEPPSQWGENRPLDF
jgi:superfamily II DNA or RNA helicase